MGLFCIFRNFWRLAQSDRFCFVKVGWVLAKKVPFLFWSEETGLTTPTRASGPIPPGWPQRTRTDCTAQAAAQTVPDASQIAHSKPRTDTHAQTLDTLHREIGTAAGAGLPAMRPAKCTISDVQFYPYLYG